jgi:hypothetical protein
VKLSLGFKGDSLSILNVQLPDEAMEHKIRAEIEGKYGPPKLDDARRDEQCIYRNGNSFTLKSGVMSAGWTDEETATTTALNLVHYQSCPSSLSSDMVRTQPSRSLSIQRKPAAAKTSSGLFEPPGLPGSLGQASFCLSANLKLTNGSSTEIAFGRPDMRR